MLVRQTYFLPFLGFKVHRNLACTEQQPKWWVISPRKWKLLESPADGFSHLETWGELKANLPGPYSWAKTPMNVKKQHKTCLVTVANRLTQAVGGKVNSIGNRPVSFVSPGGLSNFIVYIYVCVTSTFLIKWELLCFTKYSWNNCL